MLETIQSVLGLLLVAGGLLLTVRHFKIARTVAYIERFNNPAMSALRGKVDEWLNSEGTEDEKLSRLRSDAALEANVRTFMNLFVELGIAYRHRLVNRQVAFDIWDQLVPRYWASLRFYIDDERRLGRNIAHAFEDLAEAFARRRRTGDIASPTRRTGTAESPNTAPAPDG